MQQYDVLIVGGGFGGTAAARALEQRLRHRAERVLLVAPDNFFTFTPLLPEAASGTLEPRHSVIPLRQLLPRTDVIAGRVTALDLEARTATIEDLNGERHELAFRVVVLSPGAVPTVFPIPGLTEHAVGFKTLADAIWLRNRVLRQLEAAEATHDLDHRRELLTFTFVGGGYAGVEALAELESLPATPSGPTTGSAPGTSAGCWSRRPKASSPGSTGASPPTPRRSCASGGSRCT